MLSEGHRVAARLLSRVEQLGLRVQRAGRDLARHTPLREGICSNLPLALHCAPALLLCSFVLVTLN